MTRIITVTSGKGGVGKTSISLNLALSMAKKGFRVAVFDADLGLANINILTGIHPEKNLVDVIEGKCELEDIIIKNYQGIDIIPGSTGVEKLADLDSHLSSKLINSFLSLPPYDYVFFDTSAGISSQVISFCMASNEIYLIITGQPTSVTDAYSLLKMLSGNGYKNSVHVILNQMETAKDARQVYTQLNNTVKRFLSITLKPMGVVINDKHVAMAVVAQTPFVMLFPDSKASRCIRTIAEKIDTSHQNRNLPLELFWDKCFSFFSRQTETITDNGSNEGERQASLTKEKIQHRDLEKKLEQIEYGIKALVRQFNGVKELIEKNSGNRAVPLDFEHWLDQHMLEDNNGHEADLDLPRWPHKIKNFDKA